MLEKLPPVLEGCVPSLRRGPGRHGRLGTVGDFGNVNALIMALFLALPRRCSLRGAKQKTPCGKGSSGNALRRTRTVNKLIKSQLLYQLS